MLGSMVYLRKFINEADGDTACIVKSSYLF